MSKNQISAVIITFNEELNIVRCIESLRGVADEIIVVDSFSTDNTPHLCKERGAKFFQNPFTGHIEQKNFALQKASFDYILSLDADEALSPELRDSLLAIKQTPFASHGYSFNRLTRYIDKWVKHCGWYPDVKLRLINRHHAKWVGTNPHDKLQLDSKQAITHLKGNLLHYSYASISDHVAQTNKFTTIAAQALFEKGARPSGFKIYTRPLVQFVRDYFFKLGFLDGRYGFVICYINALSAFLKYSKVQELHDKKSTNRRASR